MTASAGPYFHPHTLDTDEVELVVDDLFDKRHDDLLRSKAGKFYEPELAELRGELKGIPQELRGTPLATDLLEADQAHDGYGRVLFLITAAVLADPDASPELTDAAETVRAQFIPTLAELQDRYLDEAMRAKQREPLLKDKAIKAALQLLLTTSPRSLSRSCSLRPAFTNFVATSKQVPCSETKCGLCANWTGMPMAEPDAR